MSIQHPRDSLSGSARSRMPVSSSPYHSSRSAAIHDDYNVYDPDSAFANLQVDESDIERRRAIAEADARHQAQASAAREHRRMLEQQADFARAQSEKIAERARDRVWEENYLAERAKERMANEAEKLLTPKYLDRIKEHERQRAMSTAVQWPSSLGATELGLSDASASRDVWNLEALKSTLHGGGGPLPDPLSYSSPSRHESPFDSRNHGYGDIVRNKGLLDELPSVFSEEHNASGEDYNASPAGKLYVDLCYDLYHALTAVYEYDKNLSTNLQNHWVKRLRSYYEHVKWGHYDAVDFHDGWVQLFRLLLLIEPHQNRAEVDKFIRVIESVRQHVSTTLRRMKTVDLRGMLDATQQGSFASHILHVIYEQKTGLIDSSFTSLEAALLKRQTAMFRWMQAHSQQGVRDEPANMKRIREHTAHIIEGSVRYFEAHPEDNKVQFLRSVAFGQSRIPDDREFALKWITALRDLPDEALSSFSGLWERAINIAGVFPTYRAGGKSFALTKQEYM